MAARMKAAPMVNIHFLFWDLEQIYAYLILNCVSVIFYLMIMDHFMNFSAGL